MDRKQYSARGRHLEYLLLFLEDPQAYIIHILVLDK